MIDSCASRIVPLPNRRRSSSGGFLQRSTTVPVYLQEKRGSKHRLRQNQRRRSTQEHNVSQEEAWKQRIPGGVHELRGHVISARSLRAILGDPRSSRAETDGRVLRCGGGRAGLHIQTVQDEREIDRGIRDQSGETRNVRETDGSDYKPRRVV